MQSDSTPWWICEEPEILTVSAYLVVVKSRCGNIHLAASFLTWNTNPNAPLSGFQKI